MSSGWAGSCWISKKNILVHPIFQVHSWSAIFSQSSRCHQTKQWWFLTLRALGELNPLDSHRAHCKKVFQVAGHGLYGYIWKKSTSFSFIFMQLEDSAYVFIIFTVFVSVFFPPFPCHPSPCTPLRYKTVGEPQESRSILWQVDLEIGSVLVGSNYLLNKCTRNLTGYIRIYK